MKTIGIKLADGTFYPILEEGTPKKRMLDLTTAKDNQTKVQIDLYRSENGTMEDAEYVDTLEVTKLNPHPNGEPELHLSVGLDEENKLTAEVVDPETGKKSETEVTLVSRTEAERAEPVDFSIADAELTSFEAPAAEEVSFDSPSDETIEISEELTSNDKTETTYSSEEIPEIKKEVLEDMPFSFEHSEPHVVTEISSASSAESAATGDLPDLSELDKAVPVEDKTLESVDFSAERASAEIPTGTETVTEETAESTDSNVDFSTEEFSLPDFDTDSSDVPDFSTESTDSTALPDFDETAFSDDSTDTTFADTTSITSDETTSSSEPEDFDLPDFDSLTSDSSDTDTTASATGLNFDDLDDPAFNTTNDDDDDFFGTSSESTASVGSAMDFSDLYDKETIAGEHASLYDEDEEKKKTRTPVIICIICAIICIIATVLLLFVVPSKYNLIASRNTNGVSILDRFFSKTEKVETVVKEPKEETKYIDVVVEEPKSEPAPQAVEDKIVIAPEPEKVVPVPPPAPVEEKKPEVKKTADVKYHIRWGDTLWDISESYYKTPWKYPKIATYNKIKNPDLIIAGTDIKIPADK